MAAACCSKGPAVDTLCILCALLSDGCSDWSAAATLLLMHAGLATSMPGAEFYKFVIQSKHLPCTVSLLAVMSLMVLLLPQGSSQQPRDHSTHRLRRQHSELPFHAPGRANPNPLADRVATDSRPRQGSQPADVRAGASRSRPRTADRQHTPATTIDRQAERQPSTVRFEGLPQGSSHEARLEHRPSSRQHSRQKSRPI